MSDSRWQRIKDLFAAAIALEPGERVALLDRECATDAELRAEVEGLLRHYRPRVGAESDAETLSERPGMHVGPYKLLEEIGEGGFGVVFLAEQESPVRRRVALKVIKPGMDTRQIVARFEQERQALAMMDHPSIARVFDAGTTANGRPYFVMELVRGDPITTYCDREKLTTAERLRLFAEVCRAVQHAHQKGVIHRDLKPGNVLVTIVDGKPVPKVIDFGVAKATQGRLTDKTLFTAHRQIIGTPLYMSPEQAQLSGVDVDTRSDVYSLGVLLYELLVGVPPFEQEQLMQAGFAEMYRMIRELEPQKPSTRVATLGPSSTTVAAQRGVEARRLGVLLRGDLDWIVMKCLEKERARRYDTASDLAQDLERHLAGEPVEAAPPSAVYRVRKLVRRRRTAFAAGAAVIIVALAGGATAYWQADLARRSEFRRADAEAGRADSEARRAADAVSAERKQKDLAEEATRSAAEAERARGVAEEETRKAQENAYVAAVTGAAAALRVGEPITLRRLLDQAPEEPRNWEWRYLKAQSDTSLFTLDGGGASFSADGRRIVTVAGKSAHVWDGHSGKKIATLEHSCDVYSAVLSPDGTRVITTSADESGHVWDVISGTELARLAQSPGVEFAKLNHDGTQIVTWADEDGDSTACVWDAISGEEIALLRANGRVTYASFSPDGTRIVTACRDNTVCVWDAKSGKGIARKTYLFGGWTAAFSPDGARVVSSDRFGPASVWDATSGVDLVHSAFGGRYLSKPFSPDGNRIVMANSVSNLAIVWDANSGKQIALLEGHTDVVYSAEFSPDGTRVVTASPDETARVWDANSGKELAHLEGHTSGVTSATFSPDGTLIAASASDDTTRIWDATSGQECTRLLEGHADDVKSVALSSDGTRMVTVAGDNSVRVLNSTSGRMVVRVLEGYTDNVESVAFSPDGSRIVTLSGDEAPRVWDANSGKQIVRLEGRSSAVYFAEFSPDGTRILTASKDETAFVWDASSGKALVSLDGRADSIYAAAFSPDGRRIVTRSWDDKAAHIWNTASGKELVPLEGHTSGITSVAFSRDGTRIITASNDKTARVWDASSGKELRRLQHASDVSFAAFSPDGRRIVTGSGNDKAAHIWDTDSGKELVPLEGHTSGITSVAFSPDGTRIITASHDKTARVWDASSGKELARLQHASDVSFAAFSSDGTRIITMTEDARSQDRSVSVWDCVPNRVRHAEHAEIHEAVPEAGAEAVPEADTEAVLAHLLYDTGDWTLAAAELRADGSVTKVMQRAALNLLTRRASSSYLTFRESEAKRAESKWLSRILGRESWPSESESYAELSVESGQPSDVESLNNVAWSLIDPNAPPSGREVRALLLARRAVDGAVAEKAALGNGKVAACRDTLARALFRLGRFDEALEEQRKALADASESSKEQFKNLVSRLEADIATLRDESGHLRGAEITSRIQALDREAATLEQAPDVRLWLNKDH